MNAQQLANTPYDYLRKHFNVVLARTALELQGQSCLTLETMPEPKKIRGIKVIWTYKQRLFQLLKH